MSGYSNLLVAVDLSPEAEAVLARAAQLAGLYGARLSLVHAVEPVIADAGYDFLPTVPQELEAELLERARRFLDELGQKFPAATNRYVEIGPVKGRILHLAEEIRADLIVVGTHGRHGFGLLLGSTANSLLHGTPCDVLAVRVPEPQR